MCKLSLNIIPSVYNSLQSSFLSLAWPWPGRSLPKGNQWECWDPALGPNAAGLPVHLPLLMHPLHPQWSLCSPDTPYTPRLPNAPWCHLNPCWPLSTYTPCQPPCTANTPYTPDDPPMPNTLTPLGTPNAPDATYTPAGPWAPTLLASSQCNPDTPYTPWWPPTPLHLLPSSQCPLVALVSMLVSNCHQLTIFMNMSSLQYTILFFNCHHFATDHLHKYIQFTIYHLEVPRVHLHYHRAQPISAISPKTCTLKLQLLCNTERPTKWSGHGKMIDPPGELLHTKDLLPERVTI